MSDEEFSLSIKNLHRRIFKNANREPSCIEFQVYYIKIDPNGEVLLNDGSCWVGLEKNNQGKLVERKIEGFTREEIEEGKMHGTDIQLELKIYDALKRKAFLHLQIMARR